MPHAVHIAAPVILCTEDAGPRNTAPDGQIIYKQQLPYYGHAAHWQGADLANHDVIQQAYNVGQGVLHDNGQYYHQHTAVKARIP